MKSYFKKIMALLMVFCIAAGAVPAEAAAAKISKSTLTLTAGKSATLKVKNEKKKIKWKSSDKKVATVNGKGKVTAKKAGTATITATAGKNQYTCKVTVKAKKVKVKRVKLNKGKWTSYAGSTVKLKASVSPSNATDKRITWKSSNTKVASVNADGVVTAKKAGSAIITATAKDGSKKKASCKVTVKKGKLAIKSITVSSKNSLMKGNTAQFSAKIAPAEADQRVTWKSSNTKIATVSSTGLVTAVSAGNVSITATSVSDPSKKVTINVAVTEVNGGTTPTPAPDKKISGIEVSCSLKEAEAVGDVSNANLAVYKKYSDGSKEKTTAYSVKGSYNTATGNYDYTVALEGTNFQAKFSVKKKVKELKEIQASCSLKEIASASEVQKQHLTVYGIYSDGSKEKLLSYKVNGTYNLTKKVFVFTVTSGNCSTTFEVAKKADPALTGIEASCKLDKVKIDYEFKTSDFEVKGVYADGSRKNIAFKVSISYENGFYVADITAGGFTKQLKIAVEKDDTPTITSVGYALDPSYVYVGENLAAGQLKVTVKYSDGTSKEVTDYTCDFTPKNTPGDYSFTVSWNGNTKTIPITVKEKKPAEPTLKSIDAKLNRSYIFSDETLSASDISLTGTYSDGSVKQLDGFSFDVTPAAGHGQKATVNIHYQGNNMSLQIPSYVRTEPKSAEFQYKRNNVKVGETINRSDVKVIVTDFDGNAHEVTDFDISFTPAQTAGEYPFTVSYKGFSESFTATVIE